eukprot:TRINITY_DN51905_c0_g1_i1.p1 TRINITY_DN51905_c0_g1~~TRINITY_DN51905_c0_g1_i1.p1  ORF type:complete len:395 (-),score=87.70 TRINITY_DN51905_c0_g1_i1:116-1300(-)
MDATFYKLCPIPEKGLGMVAQQDIAAGTIICTDYPTLVIEGSEFGFQDICVKSSMADLKRHYEKMLPAVRRRFDELPADLKKQVTELADANVNEDARQLKAAQIGQYVGRKLISLQFDDIYKSCIELQGTGKSVAGIWDTNCIPQGDRNAQGLYPLISRFNHSCVPNAIYQWRENLATNVVVVTKDVNAGEEICVSYFKSLFMDSKERNQRTMLSWGFKCKCSGCSIVPEAVLQKARSMSDEELDELPDEDMLAYFEKAARSDANRQQLWRLEQAMDGAMSRQQGLQMLAEMRKLLEEEGMLPNLTLQEKLDFERLNLEVIYGQPSDAKKATSDLLQTCVLLHGDEEALTMKYKSWARSARGAPTASQLYGGPTASATAGLSSAMGGTMGYKVL